MCGRFTVTQPIAKFAKLLGIKKTFSQNPRFNIAPSQPVACIRLTSEQSHPEMVWLKWGLVPSWAKDPSIGHKLINARGETVAEKPSFRKAFKHQRLLVLADGFFEWKREGKEKQPYYIRFKDHRLFAFAGLWERWDKQAEPLESCSLITTTPNDLMTPIHDRMPVILDQNAYTTWLNPSVTEPALLKPFLSPCPADEMEAYPVSRIVNNPRHDQPTCVDPLTDATTHS